MRMTAKMTIAIALLTAGCGTLGQAPNIQSANPSLRAKAETPALYPMAEGWHWRYRTLLKKGDQPERPGADQRMRISRALSGSEGEGVLLDRWLGEFQPPTTRVETTPAGVRLSRYLKPEEGSLTILKYPLRLGESWPGRKWPQADETISYAGTESVEVPAGTFISHRMDHRIVYSDGHSDSLHYWYAPGVGMVKGIEGLTILQGGVSVLNQVTALLINYGADSADAQRTP